MKIFITALLLLLLPACAQTKPAISFDRWLMEFKQEARSQGISQATLDDAFMDIKAPSKDVLERDHTQPEKTRTFATYVTGVVTYKHIAAGKEHWQSHQQLLARVEQTYGVPAPILLALWSTESNFGEHQGSLPLIDSLTTLAYDGRRHVFFRAQLLDALRIMDSEHRDAASMTGSWAGAMGQIQFMPSNFLTYAVDFDGDGVRDIWTNDADALASMANYLHSKGWNPGYGWGVQVNLPNPQSLTWQAPPLKTYTDADAWRAQGVTLLNGAALPVNMPPARLVIPDNNPATAFLVFSNYDVIMDWNHSIYFASSVGLLADAIATQ